MRRKFTVVVKGQPNDVQVKLSLRCEDGEPLAELCIGMDGPCARQSGKIIQRLEDSLLVECNLREDGSGTQAKNAIEEFLKKKRELSKRAGAALGTISPESILKAFDSLHSQALQIYLK